MQQEKFQKEDFEKFSIMLSEDMAMLAKTVLHALDEIEKLKTQNIDLREDINRLYNRTGNKTKQKRIEKNDKQEF